MPTTTSPYNTGVWVDAAFIDDWSNEDDAPAFGDWDAMAEYLAQWDYGQETDDAHTYAPHEVVTYGGDPGDDDGLIRYPWGYGDSVYDVTVGGLDYVLAVNYHLEYASLARRPLN